MNAYFFRFTGRRKGAIGILHNCEQETIGADQQAAALKLYDTHQDITLIGKPVVRELTKDELQRAMDSERWSPVTFNGWQSNGYMDPLIFNSTQLRQICGDSATFADAARCAGIALAVHHKRKEFDVWPWPTDDVSLHEKALTAYFEQRKIPSWTTRPEIAPGCQTIAQLVAKHGGTDALAGCSDLADLVRSTQLVGSYNEFDAEKFIARARSFNRLRWYNTGNPNNGGDVFRYRIGWEGSHVVYITLSLYGDNKVLNDKLTHFRPYGAAEFKSDCQQLGHVTKADENYCHEEDEHSVRWRLWWD